MNHELDGLVDDIIQHVGVKGIRWGVRNDDKPKGSGKKTGGESKLDKHPAVIRYAKASYKNYNINRAKMDFDARDPKTGDYLNTGKVAKAARITERTFKLAGAAALAIAYTAKEAGM